MAANDIFGPNDPGLAGPLTDVVPQQGQGFTPGGGTPTSSPGAVGGVYQAPKTAPAVGAYQGMFQLPGQQFSSPAAQLFAVEQAGLSQDTIQKTEQLAFDAVQTNPNQLQSLRSWSAAAPGVSPGMLLGAATSQLDPGSPLGQWLIRSAVPALSQGSTWKPPDANAVASLLTNPDRLAQLKQLPLAQIQNVLKHGPVNIGKLTDAQLQHVEQTGTLPDAGWTGYIGDVTRPLFAGLQAGYEVLQSEVRRVAGQEIATVQALRQGNLVGAEAHGLAAGGVPGTPLNGRFLEQAGLGTHGPETVTLPISGAKVTVGSTSDLLSPKQITLYQMLGEGKSAGQGFFPGGAAQQAQAQAAQQAAAINGHAMTPGRALASLVLNPNSTAYKMMSGTIDFAVANEADPSNLMLSQLSDGLRAGRMFSATTEEAQRAVADHLIEMADTSDKANTLQDWAGMPDRQAAIAEQYSGAIARRAALANFDLHSSIMQKLDQSPGSLNDLVDAGFTDHAGVMRAVGARDAGLSGFLYQKVVPENSMQWLNSTKGLETVKKMATQTGTDIYLKSGKTITPEVAWALGGATTEDQVRDVFGQYIGTGLAAQPKTGFAWAHPWSDLRYRALMPNQMVDGMDKPAMVERALDELQIGKVPKAEWDQHLSALANAQNNTDIFNATVKRGNRIAQSILDRVPNYAADKAERDTLAARLDDPLAQLSGDEMNRLNSLRSSTKASEAFARRLTTYFPQSTEEDRLYHITIMGHKFYAPSLMAGEDNPVPLDGPFLPSEILNRGVPVIGGNMAKDVGTDILGVPRAAGGTEGLREIRRQVSVWHNVWNKPIIGTGARNAEFLMDKLTNLFKVGALTRLSLPVRFLADEQARMATAGMPSMFHSPLSYIAMALGSPDSLDITGQRFADQLSDYASQVRRGIGQSNQWMEELRGGDQIYGAGWQRINQGADGFHAAWSDRLSKYHQDPVAREVAAAITNPESGSLDAVKERFAAEFGANNLAAEREGLINANFKWGSANLVNRDASDAYIDTTAQILHDITANGHQDLMKAIADGEPWRYADQGSKEFMQSLRDLDAQGRSPQSVLAPLVTPMGANPQLGRHVTRAMFSALMSTPTQKLTRSPAFRSAYFDRVQELLPYLNDEEKASALERAAATKGVSLRDVIPAAGDRLTLDQVDNLSKDYTLQTVHDTLYYPGQRSNAVDVMRNILPFGNAWKNIITDWGKLIATHPNVIRKVQQGITGARESGWFFKDPATGKEMFTMVPAGIMQKVSGVPFPMVGNVNGLNLVGSGLPGVGPVVQWGTDSLLNQWNSVPAVKYIQDKLNPYGEPNFAGGPFETLFPGWFQKLKTGGWLNNIPVVNVFGKQTEHDKLLIQDVQKQVFDYKMSTGNYNMNDPNVLAKVWSDSLEPARALYMWRGMAQFAAPAAPSYISTARMKDGNLIEQWLMANDYANKLASTGDSYKATLQFVQQWGADRVFMTQGMNPAKTYGLPTTAEAEAFAQDHSTFASKYPDLYGFFAPQGGSFDYNAYLQQIANGQRDAPTGYQWYGLALARLGNSIYSNLRDQANGSTQDTQTLSAWKSYLTQKLPGYNDPGIQPHQSKTPAQNIEGAAGLRNAIQDPAVRNTPMAQAVGQYLGYRDQALAEAKAAGYKTLSANSLADLRSRLYGWGSYIATKVPDFATIWEELLQREVQPK